MKNYLIRLTLMLAISFLGISASSGQSINLSFYSSYAFDDRFDSYFDAGRFYEGRLKGGYQIGGGIEYQINDDHGIELLYYRLSTNSPTSYLGNDQGAGVQFTDFEVNTNYIMVSNVVRLGSSGGVVEGYGGLMLGMMVADLTNPDNGRTANVTKLAYGVRVGALVWPAEKVGIRIQAQLLSAVQSLGGGFYFGSGGSGAGLTSYSTIYQFSLGGGLVLRLAR